MLQTGKPTGTEIKESDEFFDCIKKGKFGDDKTYNLLQMAFELSEYSWIPPKQDFRSVKVCLNSKNILVTTNKNESTKCTISAPD